MPPTDYAVMSERATPPTMEEQDADLILTRLADTWLMAVGRPSSMTTVLGTLVGLVVAGIAMRTYFAPDWEKTAAACGILLLAALAIPLIAQAERRKEPQWAHAAAIHEKSLPGRVPADTLALLRDVTARMTIATGWRGAYLYVSPCTEQDRRSPHYAPCCTGGTWVRGGRLFVILGEHLVAGNPALALAVLGRERRHLCGWRLYLYAVATTAGMYGVMAAAWAVPWPTLLLPVAGLRLASVLLRWIVEIGCDIDGAGEAGADAMIAVVDLKEYDQRGERALWPPAKRAAVAVLRWVTGPEHPPYWLRRAMIRAAAEERKVSR
jgi:hypothetical protein